MLLSCQGNGLKKPYIFYMLTLLCGRLYSIHSLAVQHLDNMRHAIVARNACHVCVLCIPAFCRHTN